VSNEDFVELPSKNVGNDMKKIKNSDIRHLKVTVGENTTVIDSQTAFNLRMIPRVFTAPLKAVGLVTSIFARMTNTKITFGLKDVND
jgi:hypothetical protein